MLSLAAFICLASAGQTPPVSATIPLWTGKPPGDTKTLEAERDTSGPNGRNVAGKPVIRLGNVSTPALVVYKPEKPNGASVVIVREAATRFWRGTLKAQKWQNGSTDWV